MTTWWHHPTILNLRFDRRLALRVSYILLLCIALITTLFFSTVSNAAPGVNQTIGFQGRLLDANGDIVPNGYYNIQFKIYQDGTGDVAGNPSGTLKWTETYINNSNPTGAVEVKNGFMSVNLGSLNPFGTSVDWNQDTLWLSMNIAGASTSCTTFGTGACIADGEMLPMKRMTATPYAFNSAQLGGIGSSGYIQNTTAAQTADINVTGSAKAGTIQGTTSVSTPLIDTIGDNDTLNIGTTNSLAINIGKTASANSTISIGAGLGNRTLTLGSTNGTSSTIIQAGSGGVAVNTSLAGGFVVHDVANNYNPAAFQQGNTDINLKYDTRFRINKQTTGETLLKIIDDGQIITSASTAFSTLGSATFAKGVTIQGTGSVVYTTPLGRQLGTSINIQNYTVGAYNSIISFGLASASSATAVGLLVSDSRAADHLPTIGVLSPDENSVMGLTWNGSNTTATLSNSANSIALRGGSMNLITATKNGTAANVGIGNAAAAGYALDVTGDINTSSAYRINGVSTLNNASLGFSAAATASITSATSQLLNLDGKAGVTIKNNTTTVATFGTTNIQIGTGAGTGTPTILTLDKGTTGPTSVVGGMFYNTTLGKVQCYEADGWGNCGSSPDTYVTLSPEYSNSVPRYDGLGSASSDFCSDTLNINDGSSSQPTICGTNETNSYYKWTSPEATSNSMSIYVTYKIPTNFNGFVAGSTSLMGRTDSTNSTVSYKIYRNTTGGLVSCGTDTTVSTGVKTTWQTALAPLQDPASCSFVAGQSVLFKITLSAMNNANAYVGNLNFAFKNNN